MVNNIISDVLRTKYGNDINDVINAVGKGDVSDLIEELSWSKAESMYHDDNRFRDIDDAFYILAECNSDDYRKLTNWISLAIIGMGLDSSSGVAERLERNLPPRLVADADTVYRHTLRPDDYSGAITSGFNASSHVEDAGIKRNVTGVNRSKYNTADSKSFTEQDKSRAVAKRYKGNSQSFASKISNQELDYDLDIPEKTFSLDINNISIVPFNQISGEVMESYEMHEIAATSSKRTGVNLAVSKLISMSADKESNISITHVENSHVAFEDSSPSDLTTYPEVPILFNGITSTVTKSINEFPLSDDVLTKIIAAFDMDNPFSTVDVLAGMADNELAVYLTSILARYLSHGLTLCIGAPTSIYLAPTSGWNIKIGDLDVNFDSIEVGVSRLMASTTFNWAAKELNAQVINGKFIKDRITVVLKPEEIHDNTAELPSPPLRILQVMQTRTIIRAPGHLDTNVSHIDLAGITEVDEANTIFSNSLRSIAEHILSLQTRVGSVILVDDYGYAIESIIGTGLARRFVQRHMSY